MLSPQLTMQCHFKTTAPCGMFRGSATSDREFAYFMSYDSHSVYGYEWSTEKWEELPPCPYRNSALVIMDGALTAVGGRDRSRCTNKLMTLRQLQWVEELPSMKTARSQTAVVSTSHGEYIVVIGGNGGRWISTVQLLPVRSTKWYKLTALPQPLVRPSATIFGNHVYVMGDGRGGYSCSLQDLPSSAQPTTSRSISRAISWSPLPPPPVTHSTATNVCGQLVITSGKTNKSLTKSPVRSIHQLVFGRWVEIGSMSSDRMWCLVVSSPAHTMIVGGLRQGVITDSVDECVVLQ